MKVDYTKSNVIYQKIMQAPIEKRNDVYRYELMMPFEKKWECYHVPLKAPYPGGYDVVMVSTMLGILAPESIDISQKANIESISNSSLWET